MDLQILNMKSTLANSSPADYVVSDLYNLLECSLRQNFFEFNHNLYEQKFGLAMGSPLSPFLPELFLDNFEKNIISKEQLFQKHILIWRRYVDDVFVLFRGNAADVDNFLGRLVAYTYKIHTRIRKEWYSSLPGCNYHKK